MARDDRFEVRAATARDVARDDFPHLGSLLVVGETIPARRRSFLQRVWLAADILLNTLAGGQVETISSRCGKQIYGGGKPCRLCTGICRVLDVFWPGHCAHNQMPPVE